MTGKHAEPLLWEKHYKDGRTSKSSGVAAPIVLWLFGVAFSGLGVVILLKLPEALEKSDNPTLITILAILFTIIGIACTIQAIVETIRYVKFGTSVFELVTFPVHVGSQLVGVIHTRNKLQPKDGYHLRLRSIRETHRNGGKNKTREAGIDVLWEGTATTPHSITIDSDHTTIPVNFHIPADCMPSSNTHTSKMLADAIETVQWILDVKAKVGGLNYKAQFEVPVRRAANVDASTEQAFLALMGEDS